MLINRKTRELNLNIVYYGPALSGKTTNLQQAHARINPAARSELFTLQTHEDRTIFFDYMQMELKAPSGMRPKIGLYTVPGQVYYHATRQTVLKRADGVIFVIDSQAGRLEDNQQSWAELNQHLATMDKDPLTFPVVIQLNKRDLSDALPTAELLAHIGADPYPFYEAIATEGIGVRETLRLAIRQVLARSQEELESMQTS